MFRIITMSASMMRWRKIACQLADHLGWKLSRDHLAYRRDCPHRTRQPSRSTVRRAAWNSRFYRLAKVFWRGSYERSSPLGDQARYRSMVSMMQDVTDRIAGEGNAVVVGRGAPYFLRERPDAIYVFLYAPREEKLRRLREDGVPSRRRKSGRYG